MSQSAGPVPLLRLRGLDVAPTEQSGPVLTGVTFDASAGECIALVGPSGAGKTTLLRTLAAAIPPRGGAILFDGQDHTRLSGHALRNARRRIAMITQKHDLVETLRVDRNVMAGALGRWSLWRALRFLAWPTREELAEAEAALAAVGLAEMLKRPTASLSGGEQQRVAIARAMVQAPLLLLADEPVASLDPATAADVLRFLTDLARSSGMALICSLHQPDLAARFCDRTFELRDGRISELEARD